MDVVMMPEKSYNHKIAFASFLAAVSVVALHIGVDASAGSVSWWFHQMMANGLCRWAVPFFFTVSGFFLARHVDEQNWWKTAVTTRFRTIMVPYLLWNIVYFFYSTILVITANCIAGRPWNTNMLTGWDCLMWIGLHPTKGSYNCTLWFLLALYLFVVVSPAFVWLVRRVGWCAPVILFGLSYVGMPSMPFNFNPGWMMWFVAGIAAWKCPIHVKKVCGWFVPLGLVWLALDKYARLRAGWTGAWDITPLPAIIALVIGIWAIMPSIRLPVIFTRSTFPIYLLHIYFLSIVGFLPLRPISCIVFELPLAVMCSIFCVLILHRFVPKVSSVLFGDR